MRLMHYHTGSLVRLGAIVDDFGAEHDLILGQGDFGGINSDSWEQHSWHYYSGIEDPAAYEALFPNESSEEIAGNCADAQAEMMKEEA